MKNLFVLLLAPFALSATTMAQNTLVDVINPTNYLARSKAEINVALIDYGQEQSSAQLAKIKTLLESRFYLATNKMLKLNVVLSKSIPYQHNINKYPDYQVRNITSKKRLQRLWYYDHIGANILTEIYRNVKATTSSSVLKKIDVIASVTGAQFDGLGFAYGRVGVTESPREIAWNLPNGGTTEMVSAGSAVDELIHEIGHAIYIDHASTQCQAAGMTYQEKEACCAKSASRNDVMSYCRDRSKINDTTMFYKFGACNLRNLKNKIIPAMMKGSTWAVAGREKCS